AVVQDGCELARCQLICKNQILLILMWKLIQIRLLWVGNGPAGISLSAMLAGWHPFYNNSNPHPNPQIHAQFNSTENQSLLFQDLNSAATLLTTSEHSTSNLTPFGCLYDSLVRPSFFNDLQTENENNSNKSSIIWRQIQNNSVPHIVLGDTQIGGSWTGFEDEIKAVSISNWMDLPGYSLAEDFLGDPSLNNQRPTAKTFRNYLTAYCNVMGILKNFRPNTKVLQIKKLYNKITGSYWKVNGVDTLTNKIFIIRCRNVVLACGKNKQRRLEFDSNSTSIVYDLNSLKNCISNNSSKNHPVIIVGDGISAADAVICALERNCQVLHLIRRNDRQLKNVMISRLSPLVYPEYVRVYQLMSGQRIEENYSKLTETTIRSVSGNLIELNTPAGIIKEQFLCLSICIGRQTEFPLLKGVAIDNLEQFSSTNYCSSNDSSLFAIGAMIGDHFVRYLVGGTLCTAQALILRNTFTKSLRQPFKVLFDKNERFACCCYSKKKKGQEEKFKFLRTNSASTPLTQLVKEIVIVKKYF
uniref:L-ornithine N(5)-monooxygenase n=1 Tax=Meloidogyne incognita TaxID=6306 RepID=A0A914ME07_MELIC